MEQETWIVFPVLLAVVGESLGSGHLGSCRITGVCREEVLYGVFTEQAALSLDNNLVSDA